MGITRLPRATWQELASSALYEKLALLAVMFAPFQYALTIDVGFPLKISEVLIALAAVARAYTLIAKRRLWARGLDLWVMGLLAIAVVLSTAYTLLTRDMSATVSGVDRSLLIDAGMYGAYGIVIMVAWLILRDTDRFLLRDALLAGVWLCLFAVLAQAAFLVISKPELLETLGFDMRRRGQEVFGMQLARSGPFLEGQHLGFYAGAMCVLAFVSRRWITGLAALICVVYSQSTTGVLGLVAAVVVYFIVRPTARMLILGAVLSVLAVGMTLIVPQLRRAILFQLSKLGAAEAADGVNATQSIDVRGIKSEIGWRMMLDNPILGVGPGRYGYEFPKYSHDYDLPKYYYTADIRAIAENGYIQIGAEHGIFALSAIVALFVWLFITFARRRSPLVAAVAFVAVAFATQSSWTFIPIWVVIGYLCACATQKRSGRERELERWTFSAAGGRGRASGVEPSTTPTADSSNASFSEGATTRREFRAKMKLAQDSTTPAQRKTSKRQDIQGLRAFAVLVVIFDHMVHQPSGGFAGVDMFFVISGFLITGLLLREYQRTGSISFSQFYLSRVKRILPAAMLVLSVTVVLAFVVMGKSRAVGVTWDALWAALFGANWNFLVKGTDYFQQDAAISPLQHYWSLSVEEQFYFIWPWLLLGLLLIAARFAKNVPVRRLAAIVMGLIVLASFLWAMHASASTPTSAYFSTFTRAWELGIGALLAAIAPVFNRMPGWLRTFLTYAGFALMITSVAVIDSSTAWPAPWALLPVLATALVIASGIGEQARGNVFLTNPVSVYVGDISYSLYLWHFPVIVFAGVLFPGLSGIGYVAVFMVAVSISIAAYHLVEYPLHKSPLWVPAERRVPWSKWRISVRSSLNYGFLATACVAVLVATSLYATPTAQADGPIATPDRAEGESAASYDLTAGIVDALNAESWPGDVDEQIAARASWDKDVQRCSDPDTFVPEGCRYGNGQKIALVIGDSLARAYVPAYKRALDPEEWTIVQMTLNGCEFSSQLLASERSVALCEEHNADAVEAVTSLSPDVVLVTSQWARHRVLGVEQDVPFDEWWDGAQNVLDQISAPLIYVAPPPFEKSIDACYSPAVSPRDCASTVSSAWEASEEALQDYAYTRGDVVFVSSRDWFCYDGLCPAFVNGRITRSDMVHPGQPFLEDAGEVITEAIANALEQQEGTRL